MAMGASGAGGSTAASAAASGKDLAKKVATSGPIGFMRRRPIISSVAGMSMIGGISSGRRKKLPIMPGRPTGIYGY